MDKTTAARTIRDTFENPFDKTRFQRFVRELLNQYEDKPFGPYTGSYIRDAFAGSISSYERIGKYTDSDDNEIDILIVHLCRETSLAHARTMQRNFIAWYLNGGRGGVQKEGALVAMVSPGEEDWRFSLVRMDYKLETTAAGRVKPTTAFSPARRYSFLVGVNERSHTAQQSLVPLLINEASVPTLDDLEAAFSIERVTKEFFEKYKELFLRVREKLDDIVASDAKVRDDFESAGVDTADFAKKLLGQIVFLYFLQKKGWFGVGRDDSWGDGPKGFIRSLFEKKVAPYTNFFNDILEPMFYEALAVERTGNFYSRFNCKIPFLNGGLFDPINGYDWVHTDIMLPNTLFSNDKRTPEGDTGDGILDMFDRYNFTVCEDEPLDKEVAIDPEMLGKVFENLLEVKDRKSKGTYYTPREIVHYMCQESLINYLATEIPTIDKEDLEFLVRHGSATIENDARVLDRGQTRHYAFELPEAIRDNAALLDDKLSSIRVCDPAVGSGAFLVAMMNEVVKARKVLGTHLRRAYETYVLKRHAIQDCLYGVDIDPGAVEIAKLRLWLSLVVDEEDIRQIKPLPNLDYKVMQGNSLLAEYEGIKLFDDRLLDCTTDFVEDQIRELKRRRSRLQKDYFDVKLSQKPDKLRLMEIEIEITKIADGIKKLKNPPAESPQTKLWQAASQARQKAEELRKLHQRLFDESRKAAKDAAKREIDSLEWELIETTLKEQENATALDEIRKLKSQNAKPFFLWRLNFSEVYGEKGGFDIVIANPPYAGERKNKPIFVPIQQGNLRKYYLGRMDYFYFFFHLALDQVRQGGAVAFISTNYLPTALGARKLRCDLKNRASIMTVVNLNEVRIFESATGQHNMVMVMRKTDDRNSSAVIATTKRSGHVSREILSAILEKRDTETDYAYIPQENLWEGDECYLRLAGNVDLTQDPLQVVLSKLQGTIGSTKLGIICNTIVGLVSGLDDIYVLDTEKILDIIADDKELALIRPLYKNSDIARWQPRTSTDKYILYLHEGIHNIDRYKGIWAYLNRNKTQLSARKDANLRGAFRRGNWWVLCTPRLDLDFEGEKIITPYRTRSQRFAYSNTSWYASRDVYFITQRDPAIDLKYVLALLNSKLYYLWLYHKGKKKGDMLELYAKPLSEVPMLALDEKQQAPFIRAVDRILTFTGDPAYGSRPAAHLQVRALEDDINGMVYQLYGLAPDEIAMVESIAIPE